MVVFLGKKLQIIDDHLLIKSVFIGFWEPKVSTNIAKNRVISFSFI